MKLLRKTFSMVTPLGQKRMKTPWKFHGIPRAILHGIVMEQYYLLFYYSLTTLVDNDERNNLVSISLTCAVGPMTCLLSMKYSTLNSIEYSWSFHMFYGFTHVKLRRKKLVSSTECCQWTVFHGNSMKYMVQTNWDLHNARSPLVIIRWQRMP